MLLRYLNVNTQRLRSKEKEINKGNTHTQRNPHETVYVFMSSFCFITISSKLHYLSYNSSNMGFQMGTTNEIGRVCQRADSLVFFVFNLMANITRIPQPTDPTSKTD